MEQFRPTRKAAHAAPLLNNVLNRTTAWARAHPDQAKRLSLLVHSMGAVVLQRAIEAGPIDWSGPNGGAFANVVLTSPDADDKNHATWLNTIVARNPLLVTVNRDDAVLRWSLHGSGKAPLGYSDLATSIQLAEKARYLDFTDLVGVHHRVFAKGAMEDCVAVCQIMEEALQSGRPDLTIGGKTIDKAGSQDRVLIPRSETNKLSDCFKNVEPESEEQEVEDAGGPPR